jgi:hypothetical protein
MRRKRITSQYLNVLAFLVFTAAAILLPWACQKVQDSPEHYYLTTNNQLLEYSYLSTRIYHQEGKTGKINPGFFYADTLLEKDRYLYVTAFYRDGRRSRIIRINPAKNKFETLYRPEGKNRLGRNVYAYKDTIAGIEKDYSIGERFLVLLQSDKKAFKKIKVTGKLKRKHYYSVVFGAYDGSPSVWGNENRDNKKHTKQKFLRGSRPRGAGSPLKVILMGLNVNQQIAQSFPHIGNPGSGFLQKEPPGRRRQSKRFWLIYIGFYPRWSILKVWEGGRIEKLGISEMVPVYINGNLITGDKQKLVFSKITADGLEKIKTLPAEKGLVFHRGGGRNLDQHPTGELYGVVKENMGSNKWKKVLRLDLKALELTEVKSLEKGTGSFHYCHPDAWYYSHSEYGSGGGKCILKGLYRLKQGTLELIKKFDPIDLDREGNYFKVYDAGFVLKEGGKISVYSLPGLKEIEFENLR